MKKLLGWTPTACFLAVLLVFAACDNAPSPTAPPPPADNVAVAPGSGSLQAGGPGETSEGGQDPGVVASQPAPVMAAARGGPPCAIVTLGGADIDYPPGEGPPTYRGSNLSLIARGCDGAVTGQFEDTLINGIGVHAQVTCLEIEGDDAWISGVVTKLTPATLGDFAGTPISIRVRDNGTSANDPLDQASFFFWNTEDLCTDRPDYELFNIVAGQVRIREF